MDILTPIFICVVMPVAIVWLVMRTKQNETNKTAERRIKKRFMVVGFMLWASYCKDKATTI